MPSKLNPCRECGGRARLAISIAIHGLKITLVDYMYECRKCGFHNTHYRTLTLKDSREDWNAANPVVSCETCKNQHKDTCPNSSLCYSIVNKPMYNPKEAESHE